MKRVERVEIICKTCKVKKSRPAREVYVLDLPELDLIRVVFQCPDCQRFLDKIINAEKAGELLKIGCKRKIWDLPLELSEPHPAGLEFTPEQELDFHLLLQQSDAIWFGQLCNLVWDDILRRNHPRSS